MQGSKIRLSVAELKLFEDAEVILTKNTILKKTVALLSHLQDELEIETESKGYQFLVPGKISKGENYMGLPYVVLDYPRISKGSDLFFIRSFFWWGNFYSSTLQLSGVYKERYIKKLSEAHPVLAQADYFVGINQYPWVHHFESNNYKKIIDLSEEDFAVQLQSSEQIKIAAQWPLKEWHVAATKLLESWKQLMKSIT